MAYFYYIATNNVFDLISLLRSLAMSFANCVYFHYNGLDGVSSSQCQFISNVTTFKIKATKECRGYFRRSKVLNKE